MKIPVVGFDPSMAHWGIAQAELDLETGFLDTPHLQVIEPTKPTGKQVRQNSVDLQVSEQLASAAMAAARKASAIFVEVPHGSQSARAMASYGICVGILGAIRAEGIPIIEVSEKEVKVTFTNNRNATKQEMIDQAVTLYPEANFPRQKGRVIAKAEHAADAIAAIHAGVNTPLFKNLMRLYEKG